MARIALLFMIRTLNGNVKLTFWVIFKLRFLTSRIFNKELLLANININLIPRNMKFIALYGGEKVIKMKLYRGC